MTKREKIIVGAMAAAVVFAIGDYALKGFGSSAPGGARAGAIPADQIVTQVGAQLGALRLSPTLLHVRDRATLDWRPDLFRNPPPDRPLGSAIVEVASTDTTPEYTGYFRIGMRSLGILNGLDYAEGDWTDDGAFQIIRLGPERAELLPRGKDVSISVQLER